MKNVVIAGYVRSPFTPAHKGLLAKTRPDDLAASVIAELIKRTGVNTYEIEDLILGCAFPEGEQGLNVARLVGFIAELPLTVTGVTVNRFCGSSMQAIHMAAGAIQMNAGVAFICAGVESMTRIPMTGFNPLLNAELYERYPQAYMGMGETAENLAERDDIGRVAQEAMAIASHAKADQARSAGKLAEEIRPIETPAGLVNEDGCIRPETTLAELKPAFDENGSVTAATSSPLADGAVATLICSEEYAEKAGLQPIARIKSIATAGCQPEIMGIGPVGATRKALARAGISVEDLDVIELNEAFASQALVCIRDLGLDEAKVNLDGGALALGHPLGATGARITAKAGALLQREGGRYALASQCIGGGQGIATILEAVS